MASMHLDIAQYHQKMVETSTECRLLVYLIVRTKIMAPLAYTVGFIHHNSSKEFPIIQACEMLRQSIAPDKKTL